FGILLYLYLAGKPGFGPGLTRVWIAKLTAFEFIVVLLIAVNTAASSLTKDKESKTLDITLTTPITSRYLIWGKLRGLVSSVIPLILVPTISLFIFGIVEMIRRPTERVIYFETAIEIGASLIVFSAYACMLGLHFSLKQRKTVRAVLLSVAVLLAAGGSTYWFWGQIVEKSATIGSILAPATPFTAILRLIDPTPLFDSNANFLRNIGSIRLSALIGTAIFVTLHTVIVYSWYRSMVRSFDRIIRKQSGQ
ncbi:MAG: ABC transporter permease subunit, partial [Planctomycetes bacterium]|nr:ABC transporter permease subunit [Planctomycetota bacterium]